MVMRRSVASFLQVLILLAGCASVASAQLTVDLRLDEPVDHATVDDSFVVMGTAFDTQATSGSGVDTIHLWAHPQDGGAAVFLAALNCDPNVSVCQFSATVTGLTPGAAYTLVGYARTTRNGQFQSARSSTIYAGTVSPDTVTSPGTTVTGPGATGPASPPAFRRATAIAYDDKHDVYLQVWEEGSDFLMARYVGFDGSPRGDVFVIAASQVSAPLVAYSRGTSDDVFWAVYTSQVPGGGSKVFAQRVRFTGSGASGNAFIGGPVNISSATTTNTQHPEGIVFNPVARRFMVTWVDDQDVMARQFAVDGTPAADARFVSDPSATQCGVRYTYAGGDVSFDWRRNRYLVAYRRSVSTASCGSIYHGAFAVLDSSTLDQLPGAGLVCGSILPCALTMSSAYIAERDGFVIVWDRTPQIGIGLGTTHVPSVDVQETFVPATGSRTGELIALGTRFDDTGARIAYDGDTGHVLVGAQTTSITNRSAADPSSGAVVALLGGGGTPLTGPIVEASAAVTSSVALTPARDGEFALSYTTLGGAVLQRVRVAAGTPGLRFSSVASNLDGPSNGASVGGQFLVQGWAIDFGASTETGIDTVHVWAFPASGDPIFLGATTTFVQRDDLATAFAPRFGPAGFQVAAGGLAAGTYTVVAYARSTVSGMFASLPPATITVRAGDPLMALDTPSSGATVGQPFLLAGWAIDRDATSGSGVDTLHVWAFPTIGGPAQFVGVASTGGERPDVGAAFGAQFAHAGYNLIVSGLAAGQYQIVVYAHSTVTGTFNQSRAVTIQVF